MNVVSAFFLLPILCGIVEQLSLLNYLNSLVQWDQGYFQEEEIYQFLHGLSHFMLVFNFWQ